jgi:hypothetical protein
MISPEVRLAEKYRAVFSSSPDAIDVFEDLLTDLRLYETIDTDEDRFLHNAAFRILGKMQIYEPSNMRMVTRNLLGIPMPSPRANTEPGPRDVKRS